MSEIRQLPVAVKYRGCPTCGRIITQMEADLLRFDMPCSGCSGRMVSEFIPLSNFKSITPTRRRRPD